MALILLHGTLHATIFEASNINNPHRATGKAPRFLRQFVEGIEETVGLGKGHTKLYATVDLGKARVGRTRMISDEPVNPRWYVSLHIYCAHPASSVVFTIKFDNPIGATLVGRAYLPVEEILTDEEVDRWLEICNDKGEPVGDMKFQSSRTCIPLRSASLVCSRLSPALHGVASHQVKSYRSGIASVFRWHDLQHLWELQSRHGTSFMMLMCDDPKLRINMMLKKMNVS